MLNFNAETGTGAGSSPGDGNAAPIWKILVLDGVAQRLVSPTLKVNDLREQGVTLYLQLNTRR